MGVINSTEWLRTAADNCDARAEAARQNAADLRVLANALEVFLEHPNVPDADREELNASLRRLLGGP